MKKNYEKPSMEVVVLNKHAQLLSNSGTQTHVSPSAGFGGGFDSASGRYSGYGLEEEDLDME